MRERIGIEAGDLIRCPDRATARWHRVARVGRRRDGTRYITIRRGRIWRALGFAQMQRIEWATLRALGYGLKRTKAADGGTVTATIPRPLAAAPDPRPLCPYCGTDDHLEGSPASDRCRERAGESA